ncbi:MAG: hypothetical protein KatS3mg053_1880 [Candidatus Roseilinea sp.]|nr:MAG: hypothetical protein KatS3mg053_1880 [Candidatus Roseilinea sp.]
MEKGFSVSALGHCSVLRIDLSQFSILNSHALVEPFDPAFIITDEEFNDPGAMSCEQIQAFLNARRGILKRYAVDGRTAAQIICDNAIRFGINPRLLLVMMQKEMALLTDPAPSEGALNWAMGCGPGWDSTKGFAVNVECGARTLRRNFDRPGLGQETIDGVTPVNRATLALYRYTRHLRGNRDFWTIWVGYFPQSAASGTPPEIYVDSRNVELSPPIQDEPTCRSGWAVGVKGRGGHHLATPNVAAPRESTNQVIWRPHLPFEGAYRVFVFIPDRAAIAWPCGPIAARLDTTNARYTIKHRDGVTSYAINQAPIHDGWVELGSYYFAAGTEGYVMLDDVTGEPSGTRWVSIDDMKFVWLHP